MLDVDGYVTNYEITLIVVNIKRFRVKFYISSKFNDIYSVGAYV